jgi:hypothetical protein
VALMVMEVETVFRGMPAKSRSISSSESIATPALPTSPAAHRGVGVKPDLGGQVERNREAITALGEQKLVSAVGLLRIPHPGVLAHGPPPASVHAGPDAAGKRELARLAKFPLRVETRQILCLVEGGLHCSKPLRYAVEEPTYVVPTATLRSCETLWRSKGTASAGQAVP